ncbi:MAG TPA: DUF480 domain-containing protein [Acidisarcina sp.]
MVSSSDSLEWRLSTKEARVLGSLIEKAISTPEYYPLSINALVNACNQKSNRDPFLNLPEDEVRQALHTLGDKGLVNVAPSGGRVAKYEHRLPEVLNLGRREEALLCVLLLRGAQTPGELRSRSERLFAFEDVGDVQSGLERLMRREPALVAVLARQPGMKEARYVHLFSAEPVVEHGAVSVARTVPESSTSAPENGSVESLAAQVEALRGEVEELRQQLNELSMKLSTLDAATGQGNNSL